MTTAPRPSTIALLAAAALLLSPTRAHEGHDHDAAPPALSQPLAPRVEANTPDVQLLGVLHGERLIVYLDRYASNEPITNATLEAESGAYKGVAQPLGEGSYALTAGPLAKPGKHPIVFSVEAGDVADLLNGTLDVAAPAVAEPAVADAGWPSRTLTMGAVVIALAGGALLLRRRRAGGAR